MRRSSFRWTLVDQKECTNPNATPLPRLVRDLACKDRVLLDSVRFWCGLNRSVTLRSCERTSDLSVGRPAGPSSFHRLRSPSHLSHSRPPPSPLFRSQRRFSHRFSVPLCLCRFVCLPVFQPICPCRYRHQNREHTKSLCGIKFQPDHQPWEIFAIVEKSATRSMWLPRTSTIVNPRRSLKIQYSSRKKSSEQPPPRWRSLRRCVSWIAVVSWRKEQRPSELPSTRKQNRRWLRNRLGWRFARGWAGRERQGSVLANSQARFSVMCLFRCLSEAYLCFSLLDPLSSFVVSLSTSQRWVVPALLEMHWCLWECVWVLVTFKVLLSHALMSRCMFCSSAGSRSFWAGLAPPSKRDGGHLEEALYATTRVSRGRGSFFLYATRHVQNDT